MLVNALAHRPYTQRGDIFLNFHPDRLQIVNPGVLPLGVTPNNILHTAVRRNDNLARLFHDLKLMEREGSGFDLMFEIMLAQGRHVPELKEGPDRVEIVIGRRILKAEVIDLTAKADALFQLSQRERICFGLIAQHESATARELSRVLELPSVDLLRPWLGHLLELGLIGTSGKTRAMKYFVPPDLLRKLDFPAATNLKRIEPHRLKALVLEDLQRYPGSSIGAIQKRVGAEIPRSRIKKTLEDLIDDGRVDPYGEKRWRRYRLAD